MPQTTSAYAIVSGGERTTVIFADSDHHQEAQELVAAKHATTFPWVAIELSASSASQAFSSKGAVIDLSDPAAGVTFSQSYQGMCNPAKEDRSACWLFERYTSGDDKLTGRIQLTIAETSATSSYEVMWEGLTDRFGDPVQWHRHGTSGRATGTLEVVK